MSTELPPPPPPPLPVLSPREQAFVHEYIRCLDPVVAARRAGYSQRYASLVAADLLNREHVRNELQAQQRTVGHRLQVDTAKVLEEYTKIAFATIHDLYDEDGELRAPFDLPADVAAAVSEVTQEVTTTGHVKTRYKLANKLAALDALAKHLGLFAEDNSQKGEAIGRGLADGVERGTLELARRVAYLLRAAQHHEPLRASQGHTLDGVAEPVDPS